MYKVAIRPCWELQSASGTVLPPRLIELLVEVHASGSLAAACRKVGLSYRYGWGLLREGQKLFGMPLMRAMRGRGARLTAIGERLIWVDKRINARLSPMLDSLATELEAELERGMGRDVPISLHASHGFGVEVFRTAMAQAQHPIDLKYRSPDEALSALRTGTCELAGLHLPIGELEDELLAHYLDRFDLQNDRVIHLAMRRQGLILAAGNPQGIRGLADVLQGGLRFIHRQQGSGTRLLLDCLLKREGASLSDLRGCDVEELTHAAVAAYVASGLADAGLGLEPPARRYGVEFIPIATEHYFFLCREETIESDRLADVLGMLRDPAFRNDLSRLPGYDPCMCGQVQRLPDAFPSLQRLC
ncbi:substrate-binding domain-containing protein [Solilutibacter silvestris]|uniref:PBP domain-containing protein n=1 Tax=Solilutibacter silvestris TaxID=1645665 RepID=A0A2K1PYD9_9GAMM|nr:substrate-binding domain-containing protein [Lysobacter silvestris]PNS07793.1 PBP domain-containing protein [Lysobacter silvestris]